MQPLQNPPVRRGFSCIDWSRNSRLVLEPIMAKKYWPAFVISVVPREFRVGYFIFPPVHSEGGPSKGYCVLIPPTQPHIFPPMPILVEKMNALWQTLFWTFQKYFDSGMSVRSRAITL